MMNYEKIKKKIWSLFRKRIGRLEYVYIRKSPDDMWLRIRGKVDTGAKNNSIDRKLAQRLGYLPLIERFEELEPEILAARKKGAKIKKLNRLFGHELPGAKLVVIISSHGASIRLQAPIYIKLKGRTIRTSINIYNRKRMKTHLLLGQSILKYFSVHL